MGWRLYRFKLLNVMWARNITILMFLQVNYYTRYSYDKNISSSLEHILLDLLSRQKIGPF